MILCLAKQLGFCHLGFISDPLIVSKFHNETHDLKGQENKIYNIVKGRETFYRRHTVPVCPIWAFKEHKNAFHASCKHSQVGLHRVSDLFFVLFLCRKMRSCRITILPLYCCLIRIAYHPVPLGKKTCDFLAVQSPAGYSQSRSPRVSYHL